MKMETSTLKKNLTNLKKEIDRQISNRHKEQASACKEAIKLTANEIQKIIKQAISSRRLEEQELNQLRDIVASVDFVVCDEPSDGNLKKIHQLKGVALTAVKKFESEK